MKVVAFNRTLQGSGASRRLRKSGQTPGIVYGGTEGTQLIAVDGNALFHALNKENFHSSILDLEIEGKAQQVLLRDFQMHAFKPLVLHVDFQRVDANSKVHKKIPLHFLNAEISPAVKLHSAIISHVVTEVEVTCAPQLLPEFLSVDLANLDAGGSVHVSDLTVPEGVTIVTHGKNKTLVSVQVPVAVSAEAAPAAAPAKKGKK
jgi:large subunit ribosomal protein L25